MPNNDKITTIRVNKKTKERLCKVGNYSDTADDILNRLLDNFEKRRKKRE